MQPVDDGGRVGLAQVASELGEDFVERHADRRRYAQFGSDPTADVICDSLSVAEKRRAFGYVQPAFVQPVRLDAVGVRPVKLARQLGIAQIAVVVRWHEHDARTALLRQPERIARRHAAALRRVVFGQNDTVPRFRVSGDGHRFSAQIGVVEAGHRCVKIVQITVKYNAFHFRHKSNKCS